MRWWRFGGRAERRSDLDEREEVVAHIRIEADRLVEEGVPEREALRRARERFGYDAAIDPTDTGPRIARLELVARDVRYALRRLSAAPLSTATIVLSLMVGIGANTAIFSLADQTLLRPLPVPEPDRLVQLSWRGQWIGEGRGWGSLLPHPLYAALREEGSPFASIAARSPGQATLVTPAGPERAEVALVTGDYFHTMGVGPHLGRVIDGRDDEVLDAHPVVVLSHAFWRTRFAADPDVVGRRITLNQRPMEIIGVAPEGFHGTDWSVVPALWLPMTMNGLIHEWGALDEPRVRFQHVYARLPEGVNRAESEAALQPWFGRYIRLDMERPDWPGDLDDAEVSAYLSSELAVDPGGQGQAARSYELTRPVLILTGATALLLLLACLNVANLSLARAVAGYRGLAVRAALGASRGRIVTEQLVESALLALAGGAAGVAIAPPLTRWVLRYLEVGGAPMALSTAVDARLLVTALGIAVVATLLSGVGPAWFAASTRPMGVLRVRSGSDGIRLRRLLVVGQVALALVLLAGAGLFAGTLRSLRAVGPGFSTDQLVTFTVTPVNDGYSREDTRLLLEEIRVAVSELGGVDDVGYAAWPLLHGSGWGNAMLVEAEERFVTPDYLPMNAVTPGFFDVLGRKIVRGRDFTDADRTTGSEWGWDRVIVSRSFVERYLPGREPLGVRIDFGSDPSATPRMEIVGVVEDYAEQRLRDPLPQVYFPILTQVRRGATFYVRTGAPLSTIGPRLRTRIEAISPTLTLAEMQTVDETIDGLLVFERMLSALGSAFSVFGVFLAMIGIYGVLSFMVQSRAREVGIRIALGAPRASASRLVLTDALRLTLTGVVLALPVVLVLARTVRAQLYGVGTLEPLTVAAAAAVVVVLCLAASVLPARRMARTDPLQAFRVE